MVLKKIFSFLSALILFQVMLFNNVAALASELSVSDCERWFYGDYQTFAIQSQDAQGYLNLSTDDNTMYFKVSYTLESAAEYGGSQIAAAVENKNNSYEITFSADSDDDEAPLEIQKLFTKETKYGQDIYFSFCFTDKKDRTTVNDVSLWLNVSDLGVSLGSYRFEPADAVTEVNTNGEFSTAGFTGQSEDEGSDRQANDAAGEETTKFSYTPRFDDSDSGEGKFAYESPSGSDEQAETASPAQPDKSAENGAAQQTAAVSVSEYSPETKALFALAGVFSAAGAGFLIHAAVRRNGSTDAASGAAAEDADDENAYVDPDIVEIINKNDSLDSEDE